jgi:hypothetical protein
MIIIELFYLSTYFMYLSTYLSAYLPISLSVSLPISLSASLPIYLSIYYISNPIYIFIHASIHLSIDLSICASSHSISSKLIKNQNAKIKNIKLSKNQNWRLLRFFPSWSCQLGRCPGTTRCPQLCWRRNAKTGGGKVAGWVSAHSPGWAMMCLLVIWSNFGVWMEMRQGKRKATNQSLCYISFHSQYQRVASIMMDSCL